MMMPEMAMGAAAEMDFDMAEEAMEMPREMRMEKEDIKFKGAEEVMKKEDLPTPKPEEEP